MFAANFPRPIGRDGLARWTICSLLNREDDSDNPLTADSHKHLIMGSLERIAVLSARLPTIHLTAREVEVATFLAYGASNKQIARKLSISEFTVRDHVSKLLKKFNVDSRARLAVELSAGFVVGQIFLPK